MIIRMLWLLFVMAAALMPSTICAHAEDLNLDAEREAFLARSKAEEDTLNRRRDTYLGTMPDLNRSAEQEIKPWVDPTASTNDEATDPAVELQQKNDETVTLPVGPSDANRSNKPIAPLSPDDMFGE